MKDINILIIDDEKTQRELLASYLSKKGFNVLTASSGNEGIETANSNYVEIILSDFKMPDKTGIEVLESVKGNNPEVSFVIVTAYGTVEDAVKAMKLGADDYLTKPINLSELDLLLERIIERKKIISENKLLKQQLLERYKFSSIISASEKMEEVLNIAGRSAESKASILITGESGTGKEVLAKAIHFSSPRKDKPFIAVNIPALSENLIESELFGHEKGAFTGADKMKKGRFELADGGTIFLDEVGDIPLSVQVKLLRVLQEQTIERVGGVESMKIDVRIISATNKNLNEKIKDGSFREDLFYRLNVIPIHIPPLRERKDDIIPLVEHFLRRYSVENNKVGLEISKEALDLLLKYEYPGNIRELENIIERAVVLARQNLISTKDLPIYLNSPREIDKIEQENFGGLDEQVEALEKRLIYDALRQTKGNQTQAGKILGISERILRYKMKKYKIKF